MQNTETYVCAFRGRRDSYQVPLALAEHDLLDQFITDAYAVPWVRALARYGSGRLRAKADFRTQPGIPAARVRCLWGTTFLEHARHRLGYARGMTFMKLDRHFSDAASRRAARGRSHLLLYSPYAWEAFVARYPHNPRRVLFQYHPHPDLERRLLAGDASRFPSVGESFSGPSPGPLPERLARRERDCWRHADLILCASRFTLHSLLEAGADERICRVIPYGIDVPPVALGEPPADFARVIFVGSGSQRKGLHHLLHAWRRAQLPPGSRLTLVCRMLDDGIERLIRETPEVEVRRGVETGELEQLYAASTLFAMPSLVEGFGQVYLEALAQGCPVLGTENTCLPDLGGEQDGIYLVAPGNVEELAAKLETLSARLPGRTDVREAARRCAARYTWDAFRHGIHQALRDS